MNAKTGQTPEEMAKYIVSTICGDNISGDNECFILCGPMMPENQKCFCEYMIRYKKMGISRSLRAAFRRQEKKDI
ncbi:hypothetical protein FACS1894113_1290 [Alphaproteobacteria bacterium]|nr:hypothetical protein FACS1894113_1290 [Alphaproteobacteria bacterium]